jgi:beta-glucosidase
VFIKAGESETFRFEIDPKRDLGFVNSKGEKYLDKGEYRIIVGDQTVSINVI